MAESLVFALVPDIGKLVRFDALEAGVTEMRKLVRDVDIAVFRAEGIKRTRRQWLVRRIDTAEQTAAQRIALVTADGTSALDRRTDEILVEGVREIASGDVDAPPAFFSEAELESLIALRRRVLNKGLSRIELGTTPNPASVQIVPSIEDRVNRILRGTVDALGSLDGELDALNLRHQPYFTIWEAMTGQAVRCSFELDRLYEVRELLHKRVRVSGLVRYFANGRPRSISRVERIKGMEPVAPAGERIDYWGSVPELAKGVDTVAYLKERFGDE